MIQLGLVAALLLWACIGFNVAMKLDDVVGYKKNPPTSKMIIVLAACGPVVWIIAILSGIYWVFTEMNDEIVAKISKYFYPPEDKK